MRGKGGQLGSWPDSGEGKGRLTLFLGGAQALFKGISLLRIVASLDGGTEPLLLGIL